MSNSRSAKTANRSAKAKTKAGGKTKKAKAPKPAAEDEVVRKNGRPFLINDVDQAKVLLGGLGQIQATWLECAAVLGISEPTLWRLFKRWPECKDAYETGKSGGLVSLRRNQFDLSKKNATMAIFLGMNYLGQRDMRNIGGNLQHNHQHTVLGLLLSEIDSEAKARPLIDLEPTEVTEVPGPNDAEEAA